MRLERPARAVYCIRTAAAKSPNPESLAEALSEQLGLELVLNVDKEINGLVRHQLTVSTQAVGRQTAKYVDPVSI